MTTIMTEKVLKYRLMLGIQKTSYNQLTNMLSVGYLYVHKRPKKFYRTGILLFDRHIEISMEH
jgi:hypothetical protein